MAANDATVDGCKFPVPVSFDDDTPTPDYCRVVLTVEEMKTKRKSLIGKVEATNAVIAPSFSAGVVKVDVMVTIDSRQVV